MALLLLLSIQACAQPEDTSGADVLGGGDSAGGDTGGGDTGGSDTGGEDSDTAVDSGDDSGRDTSIVHGSRVADISGHYNGTAFTMTYDTSPIQDVYCQDSGDYLLRLQDAGGAMQISVSIGDPVAGTTTTWPDLGTSLLSLGPPTSWALDTTFHGTVQSASITVNEFQPLARITGAFTVVWTADANGNPSADASGTFDLACD